MIDVFHSKMCHRDSGFERLKLYNYVEGTGITASRGSDDGFWYSRAII